MSSQYHDWQCRFQIANQSVCVSGNSLACLSDIKKFIPMYAPCEGKDSDLAFDILSNAQEHYLLLDGQQELWHCRNAQETVAAFEIQLYQQVIQRTFPDYLSLHAGCISIQQQAWMFAGQSGAGKSSITTAALLQGCKYMTDEFSLLAEGGAIAPMPRPMQWDTPVHPAFSHDGMLASGKFTREFFTFPDYQGRDKTLQLWLPTQVEHQPRPLTRLIFPRFDANAQPATLRSIGRSEALMELATHLHQNLIPSERIKMLNQRLPKGIAMHRLIFSDVHAAWRVLQNDA